MSLSKLPPGESGNDLVGAFFQGDNAAVEGLWIKYNDLVKRCIKRHAANHADAEDIEQDLWLKLLKRGLPRISSENTPADFEPLMTTIAKHRAIDHFRKVSKKRECFLSAELLAERAVALDEARLEFAEWRHSLLSKMTPIEKLLFRLLERRFPRKEIAGIFGIPMKTLNVRIHRFREKFASWVYEAD